MRIVATVEYDPGSLAAVFLLSRIIFFGGMRPLADLLNSGVIESCKRAKIQESRFFTFQREWREREERERKGHKRETESVFRSKVP